jgi:aspartyl-tRNA(Asn)/glutamyl-tRNA(Gln) amidotransferase subunit A
MAPDIFTYKNVLPQKSTEGGVLAGKKVVIQPNMSARGWLTNAGSLALEGFIALEDATVITRLRNAGAALIGSTRMSELGFGLSDDKGTRALCGGEADIALITDTMGEVRVAAATSGLFGFKPSYGIISRFGLIGLVPSMECYGIMAKSPEDIITTIGAIAGKDENDFSMPDEKLPDFSMPEESPKTTGVAGVIKECLSTLDDTELKAFEAGLEKIEEAGLTIQEVSLENFRLFQTVHNVIGSVEASSSAGKYDGVRYGHRAAPAKNWNEMYLSSRGESFGLLMKTYLFQGAYLQFENYPAFENACRIRRRLIRDTEKLFEHIDVLALPTRRLHHDPARAATIGETYDAFLLTLPANVTGQPSLQIPSLCLNSGADLGLQIISPRLSDARLLATGMRISSIIHGAKET